MLRMSLALVVAMFVLAGIEARAQDAATRTRELAAALDKTKHKKKEKHNIVVEVYVDIKNEVVVREASDYSGIYEAENEPYYLSLQVDRGGAASGTGHDTLGERRMNFTLRDATISGALLTGTKVYDNGEQLKFEAVFVNRTIANGKNPDEIATRNTKFGLGFIQNGTWSDNAGRTNSWTSRVFLERR